MRLFIAGLMICVSLPAWAFKPFDATPAEEQMCKLRVYSRLGNSPGTGLNHFCYGLYHLDRARSEFKSQEDRRYYLDVAVQEFSYAIGHAVGHPMLPEVHMEKARALRMQNRKAEGARELLQALQDGLHLPDLYLLLADHYKETGDLKTALETVGEGLRYAPESKPLLRRYKALGGTEPYPEPYEKQEAKVVVEPSDAEVAKDATTDAPKDAAPVAPESPGDESPIGNSTNPWCRFCPTEGAVDPAASKPPTATTTGP